MVPEKLVFRLACHIFSKDKYIENIFVEKLILELFNITKDLKLIYQGIKYFGVDSENS